MAELSVVISTLGMYDSLERVLDGYEHQDVARGTFEVLVVVDQADSDVGRVDSLLPGRSYPVRRLVGRRPGLSANRNTGWRSSESELVLFTDNDTIPTARLISEHLEWHRREPAEEVAVLGHVRWAPELTVTPFMRWLDDGVQFDYPNIDGIEAGWGRFYGANISVKRRFIERVGDFDEERLPYGYEDLDFACRADKLGLRVVYNRAAVVDHLRPMSLEFWKQRAGRVARSELQFVRMHPEVEPYFHKMFSHAAGRPRARGRGAKVARIVPRRFPLLGTRAWSSADMYFKQQIAPHFLAAWDKAAREPVPTGPVEPDVSERSAEPERSNSTS